jgi:hypothetical protein
MMMMVVVFIAVPLLSWQGVPPARHECNNTAIAADRAVATGRATGKSGSDMLY